MPQMAPLSWLYLMIIFIAIIMMVNTLNFFHKTHKLTNTKFKKTNNKNWKW